MIPADLLKQLEQAVCDTLGDWPEEWTRFHWPGYTLHHTQRVRRLASRLAREEGADAEVVGVAALLHDIAKAAGKDHARAGAERARAMLDGQLPAGAVARIADTIAAHNSAVAGDPLDWRVLSDADKIDANFGLVAVTRYLTIRGGRGETLADALAGVPWWQERHVELLELLTAAAGRRCADHRLVVMHRFCREVETDRVARAIAQFFLDDSVRPDLPRQAEVLASRGIPGATVDEARPFVARLCREMNGDL